MERLSQPYVPLIQDHIIGHIEDDLGNGGNYVYNIGNKESQIRWEVLYTNQFPDDLLNSTMGK